MSNEITNLPTSNFENQFESSFFYTNDRSLSSLDDVEMLNVLITRYPDLDLKNKDNIVKKQVLDLLEDKEFMSFFLSKYNLSIMDFFKFIYKYYSTIFTPIYTKKIKQQLKYKRYAKLSN